MNIIFYERQYKSKSVQGIATVCSTQPSKFQEKKETKVLTSSRVAVVRLSSAERIRFGDALRVVYVRIPG